MNLMYMAYKLYLNKPLKIHPEEKILLLCYSRLS